jgi:hypothetical protein
VANASASLRAARSAQFNGNFNFKLKLVDCDVKVHLTMANLNVQVRHSFKYQMTKLARHAWNAFCKTTHFSKNTFSLGFPIFHMHDLKKLLPSS